MTASRRSIPAARYSERIAAVQTRARDSGVAAVLVGVGADLRYLTGYPAMPLERLTMLVIPADGPASLVAPRLEAAPARACPPAAAGELAVVTWEEGDDAHGLVRSLIDPRPDDGRQVERRHIAVSDELPARHLLRLRDRLGEVDLELAGSLLTEGRIVKDQDEIELLTQAAHAADRVVAQIAAGRLVGSHGGRRVARGP